LREWHNEQEEKLNIHRRAFSLGHRPYRLITPLRPPWAADEAVFLQICDRCSKCVAVCPTGLLTQGAGGFPEANFLLGHCTFCANCARVCAEAAQKRPSVSRQQPALSPSPGQPPWSLQAVIGVACLPRRGVHCRSCSEHCETGAIRFSLWPRHAALPGIETSLCTGCGKCAAVCPAQAISMQPNCSPPQIAAALAP
jgi:ferredoxin-type protein NapF